MMIQIFIRYDETDKKDVDRIKKGLENMKFTKHLQEKDGQHEDTTREIWSRE